MQSRYPLRFSIPFIAGQWSLPPDAPNGAGRGRAFQSPSLRGSGRFRPWRSSPPLRSPCFNPLHCGAVVASARLRSDADRLRKFQSPSLRGSGRFLIAAATLAVWRAFQSPSLRGSGRFLRPRNAVGSGSSSFNPLHCGAVVASKTARARRSGPAQRSRFQSPSLRGSGRFAVAAWRRAAQEAFQSPSLRGSGRFRGDP